MTELAAPGPRTPELGYVRTSFQYVINLIDAGEDASNPALMIDLETSVRNANRVRYAIKPPATIDERLSFLVSTIAVLDRRTEDMSQIAIDANAAVKQTAADITAAADRTIAAIGDVAALTAARDAALAAQATAEAASAQAAVDLTTANDAVIAKQAELDAALADAAADATLNADTTTTAQAASATATGIAPSV